MGRWLWILAVGLSACVLPGDGIEKGDVPGGDVIGFDGDGEPGNGDNVAPGDNTPPGDAAPPLCPRTPPPDDYTRKVIVSHPYDGTGAPANRWDVWELDAWGNLTTDGTTFEMGRATSGTVAFTADGEIGLVAQEDGSLGVFRLGATVEILETAYSGVDHEFYATEVIIAPDGSRALVVDGNWRNNGGGIYGLRVECDGTLTEEGLLAPSKLAQSLRFVPGRDDRVVLPARDILDSALDNDVHVLAWDGWLTLLNSAPGFPDADTSFGGFAVTPDGRYALLGDNNAFFAVSDRVAVVEIVADTVVPIDVLPDIGDPLAIVTSPYDDAALVLDGYGNALWLLAYDATDVIQPFTNLGEPTSDGASPQLPSSAVVIDRGGLTGLVLIAENVGVRRVQFEVGGTVTDLGLTSYGPSMIRIVGALGVQP